MAMYDQIYKRIDDTLWDDAHEKNTDLWSD